MGVVRGSLAHAALRPTTCRSSQHVDTLDQWSRQGGLAIHGSPLPLVDSAARHGAAMEGLVSAATGPSAQAAPPACQAGQRPQSHAALAVGPYSGSLAGGLRALAMSTPFEPTRVATPYVRFACPGIGHST